VAPIDRCDAPESNEAVCADEELTAPVEVKKSSQIGRFLNDKGWPELSRARAHLRSACGHNSCWCCRVAGWINRSVVLAGRKRRVIETAKDQTRLSDADAGNRKSASCGRMLW